MPQFLSHWHHGCGSQDGQSHHEVVSSATQVLPREGVQSLIQDPRVLVKSFIHGGSTCEITGAFCIFST